jgi:hypothetical protein
LAMVDYNRWQPLNEGESLSHPVESFVRGGVSTRKEYREEFARPRA